MIDNGVGDWVQSGLVIANQVTSLHDDSAIPAKQGPGKPRGVAVTDHQRDTVRTGENAAVEGCIVAGKKLA